MGADACMRRRCPHRRRAAARAAALRGHVAPARARVPLLRAELRAPLAAAPPARRPKCGAPCGPYAHAPARRSPPRLAASQLLFGSHGPGRPPLAGGARAAPGRLLGQRVPRGASPAPRTPPRRAPRACIDPPRAYAHGLHAQPTAPLTRAPARRPARPAAPHARRRTRRAWPRSASSSPSPRIRRCKRSSTPAPLASTNCLSGSLPRPCCPRAPRCAPRRTASPARCRRRRAL
jgi:hypothetical protein